MKTTDSIIASKFQKISIVVAFVYLGVSIIGSFFVTPIVLNQIGDSDYGLYSFCTSVTTWFSTLSTALGSSYIFFKSKYLNNGESRINTIYFKLFLVISISVFLILSATLPLLFLFKIPFFQHTLDDSLIIYLLLYISGLNVCVNIVSSIFYLFLISEKHFLFIRIKNVIFSLLVYFFNVLFAVLTKSVVSIALVSLASTVLNNLFNVFFSRKQKIEFSNKKISNDERLILKHIVRYSLFVLLNVLVSTVNNNLDKTILGIFVDAKNVAYYSLAFSFIGYLTFAIGAISETYMPAFHNFYNKKDFIGANQLFNKISSIQLLLMVLFVFGFISSGYEFTHLWLGKDRINVYFYACVLNFLSLAPLTMTSCIDCERALNKHKFRAVILIIFTLLNVVLTVLMVIFFDKQYAIWWCILGTAISKLLSEWIILPIYDHKIIKLSLSIYFKNLLKYIFFGIISSIIPLTLHFIFYSNLNLIILFCVQVLSFVIVYFGLLFLFDKKIFNTLTERFKKKNV